MKVCCLNARIIYGIFQTHLYNPEEALFFQVKTPADLLKCLFAKPSSVVVVVVAAAWYQAEPFKLLAGTFVLYFNDPQHNLILALFTGGLCVCDFKLNTKSKMTFQFLPRAASSVSSLKPHHIDVILVGSLELAGAAAFNAGPTTIPSSSSSFSWHNRQFTSPCTQEKQKRCVLACLQYQVFCVNAEVVGIYWWMPDSESNTTAADSASQWIYWPIFFQLLNFAKKEKYRRSKVILQGFNYQNWEWKKKKKREKNLLDFYIWFSVV